MLPCHGSLNKVLIPFYGNGKTAVNIIRFLLNYSFEWKLYGSSQNSGAPGVGGVQRHFFLQKFQSKSKQQLLLIVIIIY